MRKKKTAVIIILLLMFLGIGYAFLRADLIMTGTTSVTGNDWNVQWDNIIVTYGSVSGDQVITSPAISNNTISFEVLLNQPGEYYEFTVNAKNGGSIDAMVDTVNKQVTGYNSIPNYLKYEVTYSDGLPVQENQLLKAGTIEDYKVRVEYKTDISNDELVGGNGVRLPVTFSVVYVQSDTSVVINNDVIYETSDVGFTAGSAPDNSLVYYDNYQQAITSFGLPIFMKHILDNGIITNSYIGFIYNNKLYYYSDSFDYERDKAKSISIFGAGNCNEYYADNPSSKQFICVDCSTKYGVVLYGYGGTSVGTLTGPDAGMGCAFYNIHSGDSVLSEEGTCMHNNSLNLPETLCSD